MTIFTPTGDISALYEHVVVSTYRAVVAYKVLQNPQCGEGAPIQS